MPVLGRVTPYLEEIIESMGHKVYFSNNGADIKPHPVRRNQMHLVDWVGFFVPPDYNFEDCKTWIPMHSWSIERLIQWSKVNGNYDLIDGLINDAIQKFAGKVPDSTSLQLSYEGEINNIMTPNDVLKDIQEIVNKWFPSNQYDETLTPRCKYKNKHMDAPVELELPIRVVATLVCVAFACEEANRADAWFRNYYQYRGSPRYAGCLMALGVYLYRRYTNASKKQVATILRIPVWD